LPGPEVAGRRALGVGGVGLASLFADTGHEMVTAVLPSFFASLGGSAATLGVIEGVSDALTGVAKIVGGPAADDPRTRRRQAGGGYAVTAVATAAIGVTVATWQVGVLRAAAWAARGLRTPARDSLLADLADPAHRGRAYGLERAGDNLGAVAGPLLAGGLVVIIGLRPTIMISIIPSLLAVAAILLAVRAARIDDDQGGTRLGWRTVWRAIPLRYGALRGTGIGRVLLPAAAFECGNVAVALLILRTSTGLAGPGRSVTAAAALAAGLYAVHNAVAAITDLVAGRLIDTGRGWTVLAVGAGGALVGYLGFARGGGSAVWFAVCFGLVGLGVGCAETAEAAVTSSVLPRSLLGTGFGALGAIQAAGDLVATLVAGLLYAGLGARVAFGYAAAWMVLAIVATMINLIKRVEVHA